MRRLCLQIFVMQENKIHNATRQNFRNKNPIASFLFGNSVFDYAVNTSGNTETEMKCVPTLLNLEYWLNVQPHTWILICFSSNEQMITVMLNDRNIQNANLFPNLTVIFVRNENTAVIVHKQCKSSMTPDMPICLFMIFLFLSSSLLILFLNLHIVLVCHLTLIF